MVTLTVELFAVLSQLAGSRTLLVTMPDNTTVGDMIIELGRIVPSISSRLSSVSVAVNLEYANTSDVLCDQDTIALIPPVSGG